MNLCEKVAFIALKDTKGPEIWLKASTERSESNPGRSLGIYRAYSDCCLEDSTSQRAKHPRKSDKSVFVSPLSFFSNTDLTLSLQKNATQSHKLQNNQGKSMIAEDSFVPLL